MKKILIVLVVVILGFIFVNKKQTSNEVVHVLDKTDFYEIKADYEVDKNDKNNDVKQFVDYVVDQKKEDWKDGGELYNAEQQIAKDFPDRPKMQYQLYINYATSTSKKFGTNTYVYKVYEYTGGAHGGTNLATFTFDKSGRKNIEDYLVFDQNKDIAIVRLLADKLEKNLGEDSDRETINTGLRLSFLNSDNTLNKSKCSCDGYFFPSNLQNFVVQDDGLKFIMSQYQVGAYALGMPEATLTWDELRPYLKINK